ncbi:MAG: YicC family protein [Gammaproteobacteria bacterium]|jgi:uncharacterized protein (TIGR00255 family)|nr:YicC family protein [Gammaproteobacteria bacterium]
MVFSMTGFARTTRQAELAQFTIELKSVNHRFLDVQINTPEAFNMLEFPWRNLLRENFSRGRIECFLRIQWFSAPQSGLPIDEALLNQLIKTVENIAQKSAQIHQASPIEILKWPGVINPNLLNLDTLQNSILEAFQETIRALQKVRAEEGKQIALFIEERLNKISALAEEVRLMLPELIELQKQRLIKKFEEANINLDPERLAQEMVLFAQRGDVAEELGRLAIHLKAVKNLLTQGGSVGRKLDFMMQELNREVNTLGSKSMSADVTQKVVAMKVCIEEMREQIQNIE